MLLTDARRPARTGPAGELIPLAEQDRSRWDAAAIAEGVALVTRRCHAARSARTSCRRRSPPCTTRRRAPRQTDWPQILALYGVLDGMADNPMVALNRAIATAMVHGPAAGLAALDALTHDPQLAGAPPARRRPRPPARDGR